MKTAKRVCELYPNVLFIVVGDDSVAYGGDLEHVGGGTFKDHVLAQDDYDLSRIVFVGRVSPKRLGRSFPLVTYTSI